MADVGVVDRSTELDFQRHNAVISTGHDEVNFVVSVPGPQMVHRGLVGLG